MAASRTLEADGTTVVTGGLGFIGRWVIETLLARGERVLVLDRVASRLGHPLLTTRTVSFEREEEVAAALEGTTPRRVIHLVGGRSVGPDSLSANVRANVDSTVAMIAATAKLSLESFVLASTGEVYGDGGPSFVETMTPRPESPYGVSKWMAEVAVLGAWSALGLPGVVARLGVVYGAGQENPAMFVPQLLGALRDQKPFEMSPGDQTRDFVFVADAAEALVRLATRAEAHGQIVNVGTGRDVAVGTMAEKLVARAGSPIAVKRGALPYRAGELMRYRLESEKLLRLTGYALPTDIDAGIDRTLSDERPLRGLEQ
jgi:nucleoside-diphosphate-sugar epimerase